MDERVWQQGGEEEVGGTIGLTNGKKEKKKK